MTVYAFVDAQKTDFTIATLCRVCGASTSGFYDWVTRSAAGPSDAARDEAEVLERIRVAHRNSRGRYGEPRITAQLARDGVAVNHKRVERLMAVNGITGRCGRKKVRTTVRDPAAALSADLVNRHFEQATLDVCRRSSNPPRDGGGVHVIHRLDVQVIHRLGGGGERRGVHQLGSLST